jgi:hypothetical protein
LLKYPLLPDPVDQQSGNAAPVWVRAGLLLAEEQRKLKPGEFQWFFGTNPAAPDAVSKDEARQLLDRFAGALRLADQAARRTHCDWDRPLLTVQNIRDVMPSLEIQLFRPLERLIYRRFRSELREGQFDRAIYSLQTGLALARHIGTGGTLMEVLVGNAFASVMFEGVDEWVRTPGSPDLYWSLAALPSPFFDVRTMMARDLGMLHRSYPALRRLYVREGPEALKPAEAERLANEVLVDMFKMENPTHTTLSTSDRLYLAVVVTNSLGAGKTHLLDNGWKKEQVASMSANEIVLRYFVAQYDEVCTDVLKWLSLPPWLAEDRLVKTDRLLREILNANHNLFLRGLFPAVLRVFQSCLRTDRQIATFRCVEALRLYSAEHGGKVPVKLADVTDVPLPIDPGTGKGFDSGYTEKDGIGVLEVTPKFWIWRYEIAERK